MPIRSPGGAWAALPGLLLTLGVLLPLSATAQSTPIANYRVTFDAIWSAATHPIDIPPDPHFSGLIGGTHNDQVTFWQTGSLASNGIKDVAEEGDKTALTAEVNAAITAGTADLVISGPGIFPSPGSAVVTFTAHEDYPLLTLISMLAPSPDWFVGVSSLNLVQGGEWADEIVVELRVYDAGTDSGVTFTSPNQPTNPPEPIFLFDTGPFAGSMEVVGTYTIELLNTGPPVQQAPISTGAVVATGSVMALAMAWYRRRAAPSVPA